MSEPGKTRDRRPRPSDTRFAEKRAELAMAALQTLAELGYARTSLRDIAQNSPYSHGVLHYYFSDKVDLITECVKFYKNECVKRYDLIVADAHTAADLRMACAEGLAATMVADATMHRLWYDLRSQCLFDQTFSADVADIDSSLERMVWRVVERYSELREQPLTVAPGYVYAVLDGLFQHNLMRHLAGDPEAAELLRRQVRHAIDHLFFS